MKRTLDHINQETKNGKEWNAISDHYCDDLFALLCFINAPCTLSIFNDHSNAAMLNADDLKPVDIENLSRLSSWHPLDDSMQIEGNSVYRSTQIVSTEKYDFYIAFEEKGDLYLIRKQKESNNLDYAYIQYLVPVFFLDLSIQEDSLFLRISDSYSLIEKGKGTHILRINYDKMQTINISIQPETDGDGVGILTEKDAFELWKNNIYIQMSDICDSGYGSIFPRFEAYLDGALHYLLSLKPQSPMQRSSRAKMLLSSILSDSYNVSAELRNTIIQELRDFVSTSTREELRHLSSYFILELFKSNIVLFRLLIEKIIQADDIFVASEIFFTVTQYDDIDLQQFQNLRKHFARLAENNINHSLPKQREIAARLSRFMEKEKAIKMIVEQLSVEDDYGSTFEELVRSLAKFKKPDFAPIYRNIITKALYENWGSLRASYIAADAITSLGSLELSEDIDFFGKLLNEWDKPVKGGPDDNILSSILEVFEITHLKIPRQYLIHLRHLLSRADEELIARCDNLIQKKATKSD